MVFIHPQNLFRLQISTTTLVLDGLKICCLLTNEKLINVFKVGIAMGILVNHALTHQRVH